MVEDAYVLCDGRHDRGGRARCATSRPLDGDVEELDGRGLCAIPGLVDCHTHACFARRPRRGVLAARGRRELRGAARGAAAASSRPSRATRARPARTACATAVERHRDWMLRARDDDVRGEVRLRARPRHRARVAAGDRGSGRRSRPGSARTRCRRSSTTPTRTSTSRSPRCCPRRRQLAEAADVFLERGAFDARQARRYLEACRDAGLALRLHGDQFTELGAIPLAIELGARSVDHLEATGDGRRPALAASDVVGVLLPASALFLGRPMPPARAPRRRRRRRRARHRLQPRQRVLREPAARLLARLHAAQALAGGGARRVHGQRGARARPRRPARAGSRRAIDADSSCSTRPTGATSRTTSAASCRRGRDRGRAAWRAERRYARPMPTKKQRRRREKERRHEYEFVYVDERGPGGRGRRGRAGGSAEPTAAVGNGNAAEAARSVERAARRKVEPPSWRRVSAARSIFAPLIFVAFIFQPQAACDQAAAACSTRRSSSRSATHGPLDVPHLPAAVGQAPPAHRTR